MEEELQARSFWERLNRSRRMFLYVCHLMLFGVFCSALGGENLVSERWPTSSWRSPLQVIEVLGLAWLIMIGPLAFP